MKEGLEYLMTECLGDDKNVSLTNDEIGEFMDWYAEYNHKRKLKLLNLQNVSGSAWILYDGYPDGVNTFEAKLFRTKEEMDEYILKNETTIEEEEWNWQEMHYR